SFILHDVNKVFVLVELSLCFFVFGSACRLSGKAVASASVLACCRLQSVSAFSFSLCLLSASVCAFCQLQSVSASCFSQHLPLCLGKSKDILLTWKLFGAKTFR
ncbi:MAG: hypothetical protein LUC23_00150, partial [Prevotellaceae bacterium]|nr:hypothetical protein [Prevotellaceae bacterium]